MDVKKRIVASFVFVSGLIGMKSLKAQVDTIDAKTDTTELKMNSIKRANVSSIDNEARIGQIWARSENGRPIVEAYMRVMSEIGEPQEIADNQYKFLMALSKADHSLFSLGETDYVFSSEDLKAIKPDSLALAIADNFGNAITPDRYPGKYCGHAAKVIIGPTGAAPEALGIESAYELIDILRKNPNFTEIAVEVDENPEDVKCLPLGTWKVYDKTKKHKHGHTGFSNQFGGDTSDKSRNMIDLNNYSGLYCFVTVGCEVGEHAYFSILAQRCKRQKMSEISVLQEDLDMRSVQLKTITPEALLCEANEARELALSLFNNRSNNATATGMRVNYPYILDKPVKLPRLAHNAKPGVRKKARTRNTQRRYAQLKRRGTSRG